MIPTDDDFLCPYCGREVCICDEPEDEDAGWATGLRADTESLWDATDEPDDEPGGRPNA